MPFTKGQSVQVKAEQKDEDTGISIAGWSGRIIEVHDDYSTVELEWDSPTLYQMPHDYIRRSLEGGYDYFRYYIEPVNLEPIEPRDAPQEVKEAQDELEAHYEEYERYGTMPPPFSEIEREAPAEEVIQAASDTKGQLLAQLKTIEGSGSFAVSGTNAFTLPGLEIEGVGEIGFPVPPVQLQAIIKRARKAPFGKGSQTITDTSVRSAWEVDAGQLSFQNKEWEKALQKTVKKVKEGLGIEGPAINASLYKLLIYEEGDFFLSHQDSEKEPGMFATLVVGLPSTHSGGELSIRFDGREETVDFAPAASTYQMPFAAFYADCEHEIKPVTSGYRVCLVYNLLQAADAPRISSPRFQKQVEEMAELLRPLAGYYEWKPLAVLLGHQYTPANFSLAQLKLHDRPRAEALMEAAEKAGYFASLGLVTLYLMGQLEGADDYYFSRGRYYDYDDDGASSGGTMGEVYEEYMTVKHWGESDAPGLGEIHIRQEDIIAEFDMGEEDPIEQEEEGYTGNAGMTIQYWYHYGAVILWPRNKHFEVLASKPVSVRLQWIGYYLRHWEDTHAQEYTRKLLASLPLENLKEITNYSPPDFSVVALAFAKIREESFLQQHGQAVLPAVFKHIAVEAWLPLIQAYDPAVFNSIYQKAADTNDVYLIRHLTEVLTALDELSSPEVKAFVADQAGQLPDYLRKAELHKLEAVSYFSPAVEYGQKRQEAATAIVENILALSPHKEGDPNWIEAMLERITQPLPRAYANRVLAPILLSGKYSSRPLAQKLSDICIRDLQARTKVKPTPPPDWKRPTPQSKHHQHLFDILHPFLSSPTQRVFDYVRNQSERSEMERAINSVDIDLKMETIQKGRPYTLRLTKTQAAYERKLKEWGEDVALLEQLRACLEANL